MKQLIKSYALLLLLLISKNGISQNQLTIDSLERVLITTNEEESRAIILNELSFLLLDEQTQKAEKFAQEALSIAKSINKKPIEASSYIRLGIIEEIYGNYKKSSDFYFDALQLRNELKDSIGIAKVYNNLGNLVEIQGDYIQSEQYYLKGLAIIPAKKNAVLTITILSNLGATYKYLNKYSKALKTYLKALEQAKKINSKEDLAYIYQGMGSLEGTLNNHKKSLEYYTESLKNFSKINDQSKVSLLNHNIGNIYFKKQNYIKAREHYQLLLENRTTSEQRKAIALKNIALTFQKQGNLAKALDYYKQSLNITKKTNNPIELAIIYNNLGLVKSIQENHKEALNYFLKGQELASSISDKMVNIELLINISNSYAKLNQFEKAFNYRDMHQQIERSLNTAEKELLNYKIERVENEKEITILNKNKELQSEKERLKTITIIGLVLLSLLLSLLFFLRLKAQKQKQKQLFIEKEIKEKNIKINTLLKDAELKSTYAKLEGQDIERQRIAQDLHDRLGGTLSTVKLYFKTIDEKKDELKEENKKQYLKVNELLDTAFKEVREISYNMQSGLLIKFGLDLALKDLVETVEKSGQIKARVFTLGLEERLGWKIETNIYRIIQGLVSNVLRHAQATELTIRVNRYNGALNILVEDNGIGFDISKVILKEGIGLKNIESRVDNLGGTLSIDSGKGGGSTISIDLTVQ